MASVCQRAEYSHWFATMHLLTALRTIQRFSQPTPRCNENIAHFSWGRAIWHPCTRTPSDRCPVIAHYTWDRLSFKALYNMFILTIAIPMGNAAVQHKKVRTRLSPPYNAVVRNICSTLDQDDPLSCNAKTTTAALPPTIIWLTTMGICRAKS